MINISLDNHTYKIKEISYENEYYKSIINHQIFDKTNQTVPMNIGHILETYRTNNDHLYFNNNKSILEEFIQKINIDIDISDTDYLFCFYPADFNRKYLLKKLTDKIKSNFNTILHDYSDNFQKVDSEKSIKKDFLTEEDYILSIPNKIPPIKNLLVIDDIIDKGDTLNIFLNKMNKNGIINCTTKISLICLYENPRKISFDFLDFHKKNLIS